MRSKSNAESVALNASLRKEQMKAESLERALEQKVNFHTFTYNITSIFFPIKYYLKSALLFQNQETEELTKICDELIAKLGTTD